MNIDERNRLFISKIRDEVEEFHEFFLSHKFGEQIKNERVANQFINCIDMLTRSYVHFMGEFIDGRGGISGAKEHLDHLNVRKNVLEEIIEDEFK